MTDKKMFPHAALAEAHDLIALYEQSGDGVFVLAAYVAIRRAETDIKYEGISEPKRILFVRLQRSILAALEGYAGEVLAKSKGKISTPPGYAAHLQLLQAKISALPGYAARRIVRAMQSEYARLRLLQAAWLAGKRETRLLSCVEAQVRARVAKTCNTSTSTVYRVWSIEFLQERPPEDRERLMYRDLVAEVEANVEKIAEVEANAKKKPTKKGRPARLDFSSKRAREMK